MILFMCVCVCFMHHTNIIIFSVRNKFYIIYKYEQVIKVYEVLITTLRTFVQEKPYE